MGPNVGRLMQLFHRVNRMNGMKIKRVGAQLAALLTQLREERGISQMQLAHHAGVNPSVVNRTERGGDARLSTWVKLFESMGHRLLFDTTEESEEAADLLSEEAEARRQRRRGF